MNNHFWRDVVGWGVGLWFIGYALGFLFFAFVPPEQIGWYVMPLGIAITVFALYKWVRMDSVRDVVMIGIGWSIIAVLFDYLFLVQLLHPVDGYYKFDVYLYYALTLALPLIVYQFKRAR